MESHDKPQSSKISGGVLASLFLSSELRWVFFTLVVFLCLVGTAFFLLGLYSIITLRTDVVQGLGYSSVGLLFIIVAFGVLQMRRYLHRIQEVTVDRITGIELGKLNEGDFERFDDVRRLRAEKAQMDFERNLGAKFVLERFGARNVRLFSQLAWDLQPVIN